MQYWVKKYLFIYVIPRQKCTKNKLNRSVIRVFKGTSNRGLASIRPSKKPCVDYTN